MPAEQIKLPTSPIPLPGASLEASSKIIAADQWLHSNGWRDLIVALRSADAREFLGAYGSFRRRLDNLQREARWRGMALGALLTGIAGFVTAAVLRFLT